MTIERLTVCPRCGGKMMHEFDSYGLWEECLQCGYWRQSQDCTPEPQGALTQDKLVDMGKDIII